MEEQICSKCNNTKILDEFPCGNKINGKSSWCKLCTANQSKKYYSNPEVKRKVASQMRLRRKLNPERTMLTNIKARAVREGIAFNLTIEDCQIPDKCPVLGITLVTGQVRVNGMHADNTPSMDKINPNEGYTKGNVCVISWRANHLKNNATQAELEQIIAYMKERA